MTTPYDNGYHAGLLNDRTNPHALWSPSWLPWLLGNSLGLDVHCAIVEAVYLRNMEE
jgi:hypothetical protein